MGNNGNWLPISHNRIDEMKLAGHYEPAAIGSSEIAHLQIILDRPYVRVGNSTGKRCRQSAGLHLSTRNISAKDISLSGYQNGKAGLEILLLTAPGVRQ